MPIQPNNRPEKDTLTLGLLNTHKSSSDHDGRYYTESEVDSKLLTKADKKIITEITKVDGYITTFKANGVLRTVHRDINGIITEII